MNQRIADLQRFDLRMYHYPSQLGYQPLVGIPTGTTPSSSSHQATGSTSSPPLPPPPPTLPLPSASLVIGGGGTTPLGSNNTSSSSYSNATSSNQRHYSSVVQPPPASSLPLPPPPSTALFSPSTSSSVSTHPMDYDETSNSSTLASSTFSYKDPAVLLTSGAGDNSTQNLFNRKLLHHQHPVCILQSSASTTNLHIGQSMANTDLALLSNAAHAFAQQQQVQQQQQQQQAQTLPNASLLSATYSADGNNNSSSSAASSSSVSAASSSTNSGSGGVPGVTHLENMSTDPSKLHFLDQLIYFRRMEKQHSDPTSSTTLLSHHSTHAPSNPN